MIERIPDLVNADANLVRRGRFLSTTFLVEISDQGYLVTPNTAVITRESG